MKPWATRHTYWQRMFIERRLATHRKATSKK